MTKKQIQKSKKEVFLETLKSFKDKLFSWKGLAILFGTLLILDIIFTTQEPRFHMEDVENLFVRKEMISDNIVFLGDSITEQYQLDEFYEDIHVVNSGIGGNITDDILNDMYNRVYRYNPSKVFLMIGTNDLTRNHEHKKILDNIREIIKNIQKNRPYTEIYVESIYPISETIYKDEDNLKDYKTNKIITDLNKKIKEICREENVEYIDVYSKLLDDKDELKESYTEDGLHLNALGYLKVTNTLLPYIVEKETLDM